MKRGAASFALLLLLLTGSLVSGQAAGQSGPKKARTPEDYKPRTLKELDAVKADPALGDKQERLVVHADILPSRIRMTYANSTRPLSEAKKEVIRQWARLYAGSPDHYTMPYETELLFEEAGDTHWIAIPQRLLPLVHEKLEPGNVVDLYLIRLGKIRNGVAWEPLLLIEQFEKCSEPLVTARTGVGTTAQR